VSGFDLFLESNSANVNNAFSITGNSPTFPGTPASIQTFPDFINTTNSDHAGFAQNDNDQGYNFAADHNVPTNLETLTLTVGGSTPLGSYTFFTTSSSLPENNQTLIFAGADESFNQYSVTQASFTVTVVPEPSTWLAGAAAAGLIGYTMLRRRTA
jgi:hypothetical protein